MLLIYGTAMSVFEEMLEIFQPKLLITSDSSQAVHLTKEDCNVTKHTHSHTKP